MKGTIIMKPIITEKMHILQEKNNSFAFQVAVKSNKLEIKSAIEAKFGVRVANVRTMNIRGKMRSLSVRSGGRVIRTEGKKANWKKAIITLVEGDTIDVYGNEPS